MKELNCDLSSGALELRITCIKCRKDVCMEAVGEEAKTVVRALYRDDHDFFCESCAIHAEPEKESRLSVLLGELMDWAVERQKGSTLSLLKIKSRCLRAKALGKSFQGAERMEFDRLADTIDLVIPILTNL